MTPEPPALRARELRKVYYVAPRLRSLLFDSAPPDERSGAVVALDDVGFDLDAGRALAIIGANGAGKSTLLRILAGLSLPSAGSVECGKRIGTLLDLGAGLVDEWTGAVNARSALALQGLPPARLAEIEASADVGSFFARPVRTYSTGMRLRLAYALALGLVPEVLIADEVVAVGDEAFQRRCALQLQRFLGEGGTLVLATHNLYLADKLCQHAIWLERGRVRQAGPTREVTAAYRDAAASAARERHGVHGPHDVPAIDDVRSAGERVAPAAVEITVESADGGGVVTFGGPWSVRVAHPETLAPGSWLDVRRADGTLVARLGVAAAGLGFTACALLPGRFSVELCEPPGGGAAVRARVTLLVRGARRELGSVVLEHEWL